MSFHLLAVLAVLLAVSTLMPLSRREAWWVRGWDFPRLQLFIVALALMLAELLMLNLRNPAHGLVMLTTLACLIYQAWWIVPYTRLFRPEVNQADASADAADRLCILSANVLMSNRDADRLLAQVALHQPDLLVTLETDAWWQARVDTLARDYPHTLKCPLSNRYGMHLYSRLPLSDAQLQFLVEPDVPSMHACVQLRSGQQLRLHLLHPAPPSPVENSSSSERDAELLVVGRSVAGSALPVVVAGDLNDVAWSATTRLFRRISGLLDPRVGRGMFNTFHAGWWCLRWPLDHVFHSPHFQLIDIRRLPAIGSDHFPVLVSLLCSGRTGSTLSIPAADSDDRSRARRKLAAEDVRPNDVHVPGG